MSNDGSSIKEKTDLQPIERKETVRNLNRFSEQFQTHTVIKVDKNITFPITFFFRAVFSCFLSIPYFLSLLLTQKTTKILIRNS